jgi:serine/threonine-protein kinase HipA
MYLDESGTLSASAGKPFTHILKPAGTAGFEALPVIEWLALAMGRAAGFAVPVNALVPMPDGMPPELLVERFDIREGFEDKRLIALEDLSSVLDLPPEAKSDGTIERIARAVRAISTAPDQDLLIVLKRALFAWLIADGDMHLKNIALLKIAEPGDEQFRSVRMAPLYDAVTTRVFPRLERDRMALKLNGKDDKLRRTDFRTLSTTAGIRASDADAAIDDLLARTARAAEDIALPKGLAYGQDGAAMAARMLEISGTRSKTFT